jgi:hypothetical protein
LEIRTDAVHGKPVHQRPGHGGGQGHARQQVALGIVRQVLDARLVDGERELHPLVMRELAQERRVCRAALFARLEEPYELAPDLGEQRRVALVPGEEAAHQRVPVGLRQQRANYRKIAG